MQTEAKHTPHLVFFSLHQLCCMCFPLNELIFVAGSSLLHVFLLVRILTNDLYAISLVQFPNFQQMQIVLEEDIDQRIGLKCSPSVLNGFRLSPAFLSSLHFFKTSRWLSSPPSP